MYKKKSFTVDEIKKKLENFCIYQDRCHKEVEQKMSNYNLIFEAKELILLYLIQYNFLNEERFSKSFARGKFRIKKWGKQRIIRELKYRNISVYNINSALKEIDETEYLQTIITITERKNKTIKEPNLFKRKKKLVDFLLRKGFDFSLVYQTVNNTVLEKTID